MIKVNTAELLELIASPVRNADKEAVTTLLETLIPVWDSPSFGNDQIEVDVFEYSEEPKRGWILILTYYVEVEEFSAAPVKAMMFALRNLQYDGIPIFQSVVIEVCCSEKFFEEFVIETF
jgi:hypothetical protein